MPPQNTDQVKNKLAPGTMLILQVVFLVMVWIVILLFPEVIKTKVFLLPLTIIGTLYVIYSVTRYVMNPQKYSKQQTEKESKLEESTLGRMSLIPSQSWTVDIETLKIIFKKFQLFLPFLISIVVIVFLIRELLFNGFDRAVLNLLVDNNISSYLTFPILFLVNSFFAMCIFVLGYITLGYILRKKYLNVRESPVMIIMRFFKLLNYIIILSFVWTLAILVFSSRRKNVLVNVVQTATVGFLSISKLFLYSNIIRVSLGEEKAGLKETYEFAKKDFYQILRVWFGSGLLISAIFFVGMFVLFVISKTGLIEATEANNAIIAPVFFISLGFVFVFRAFSEQIGLFGIYIKDKYNIDIFSN
jgi:hypothetical protein